MLGKIFWGMVILLFVAILVIPFLLPSYYASQAEAQYYEDDNDGTEIEFSTNRKKKYTKSVRSSGGSRSYRSGK